jgi:hypothetical protein
LKSRGSYRFDAKKVTHPACEAKSPRREHVDFSFIVLPFYTSI